MSDGCTFAATKIWNASRSVETSLPCDFITLWLIMWLGYGKVLYDYWMTDVSFGVINRLLKSQLTTHWTALILFPGGEILIGARPSQHWIVVPVAKNHTKKCMHALTHMHTCTHTHRVRGYFEKDSSLVVSRICCVHNKQNTGRNWQCVMTACRILCVCACVWYKVHNTSSYVTKSY